MATPSTVPQSSMGKLLKPKIGFFARLSNIWLWLSILFVISILANAVIISIEAKDISPGVSYLGNKIGLVTQNLNAESLKVIENQGIYAKSDSFITSLWNFFKSIWKFIVSFFMIYLWLRVLSWIFRKVIIMDDSKKSSSFILAIIFFFLLQVLCIAIFTEDPIMTPFSAFSNFVQAMPYIFKPLSKLADKVF